MTLQFSSFSLRTRPREENDRFVIDDSRFFSRFEVGEEGWDTFDETSRVVQSEESQRCCKVERRGRQLSVSCVVVSCLVECEESIASLQESSEINLTAEFAASEMLQCTSDAFQTLTGIGIPQRRFLERECSEGGEDGGGEERMSITFAGDCD